MDELINKMAEDLCISPYLKESKKSFYYRVLLSGLGLWCLKSASNFDEGESKTSQSIILNTLIERYIILNPDLTDMLKCDDEKLSVFIRRVYEEMGYLITDSSNRNHIARYGRCFEIGTKYLFFGLKENIKMEGLGVYTLKGVSNSEWRKILIRDELNCEQYLNAEYNIVNFKKRDILVNELQFFNPLSEKSPSASWGNKMTTNMTMARKTQTGPFYKVINFNDEILFCEQLQNADADDLTSYEYRRIYFALKNFYKVPFKARIKNLDKMYSLICLDGHLPNREYYILLMCAWPKDCFVSKTQFIIKNENINFIKEMFNNIGIKVIGG